MTDINEIYQRFKELTTKNEYDLAYELLVANPTLLNLEDESSADAIVEFHLNLIGHRREDKASRLLTLAKETCGETTAGKESLYDLLVISTVLYQNAQVERRDRN